MVKKNKSWVKKSIRHDYLTPVDFVEILLRHLGRAEFDLDVCCSIRNIPARRSFTEEDDAFDNDWKGLCWMNPPCGQLLQRFCGKMLQEVSKDAEVWALLPSRFPSFYCVEFKQNGLTGIQGVLRQANLVYMIPEWTFQFDLPGKKVVEKAKTSWWLCHFGGNGREVEYAFRQSDPFKGTKYEGVLLS